VSGPAKRFTLPATAILLLIKDNRILLCRRYNTGWEDGKYGFMAGHIDGNESFRQALCREAKEELGITIQPDDVEFVHGLHARADNRGAGEYMYMFFTASVWQGEPKVCEPDKCDDARWFPLDGLPSNLVVNTQMVIEAYHDKVYYSESGF
jgi:8-oxo-dGTP diphosphatase